MASTKGCQAALVASTGPDEISPSVIGASAARSGGGASRLAKPTTPAHTQARRSGNVAARRRGNNLGVDSNSMGFLVVAGQMISK
jgi:hypothetical protein